MALTACLACGKCQSMFTGMIIIPTVLLRMPLGPASVEGCCGVGGAHPPLRESLASVQQQLLSLRTGARSTLQAVMDEEVPGLR